MQGRKQQSPPFLRLPFPGSGGDSGRQLGNDAAPRLKPHQGLHGANNRAGTWGRPRRRMASPPPATSRLSPPLPWNVALARRPPLALLPSPERARSPGPKHSPYFAVEETGSRLNWEGSHGGQGPAQMHLPGPAVLGELDLNKTVVMRKMLIIMVTVSTSSDQQATL